MNADTRWRKLAEEMRRPGPDCLSVEDLRHWVEEGEISTEIHAHLDGCVRCHIEARELRSFFVEPSPDQDATAPQPEIKRRLEAVLFSHRPETPARAAKKRSRVWWPQGNILWPGLAAATAVMLVILAAPTLMESDLVPVPSEGSGVSRSIAPASSMLPQGLIGEVPGVFSWQAAAGETGPWEFRLQRVDGSVIWSARVVGTQLEIPASVREQLSQATRYSWSLAPVGDPDRNVRASFTLERR